MLLNNQCITEEVKLKIKQKQKLETNDNKKQRIQNECDAAKSVLRGKFITIQSYFRK